MKKILFLLMTLILASVIELTILFYLSMEYVHLTNYWFYTPFLIYVICSSFLGFSTINTVKKVHIMNLTLGIVILIVVPLVFSALKPEYTYKEAQEKVKMKEQITIVHNSSQKITVDGIDSYYIKGEKHEKEKLYSFNPRNGEYGEL